MNGKSLALVWLLLSACHQVPSDFELPPQSGTCSFGFELTNRYLGAAFSLQAPEYAETYVRMAPRDPERLGASLWVLEAQSEQSARAYRIANVGFPHHWLSNLLIMTPKSDPLFPDWFVEHADDEFFVEVPLHLIHPAEVPANSLDTAPSPPYDVQLAPGVGDAGQHWRLAPHALCAD